METQDAMPFGQTSRALSCSAYPIYGMIPSWKRALHAKTSEHTVSSGNVFADLGLPNAEELQAKAALSNRIADIVSQRQLTQVETAKILGTRQPKVSELLVGRADGFSIERLIRYLNALDRDVQIIISPKPRSRARATLRVTGRSRSSRVSDAASPR